MDDSVRQILQAAELFRKGDVATGMKQIAAATGGGTPSTNQPPQSRQVPHHPTSNAAIQVTLDTPRVVVPPPPLTCNNLANMQLSCPNTLPGISTPSPSLVGVPVGIRRDPSPEGSSGLLAFASESAVRACASPENSPAISLGIDPERLRLAQVVGTLRLRMIQEAVQQQYIQAYAQQILEAQQIQEQQLQEQLQEKQQEAAQLTLIMQAAEAQAEQAKQKLDEDQEEHHWHRRVGRQKTVCGHWQRGHCSRGGSCQFSHPEKDKGTLQTRGPADIMRHNFKTSVCRYFSSGSCPQGTRCMFAHGPSDLRTPGMSLSKDEDEIVQRVAAAKISQINRGTLPGMTQPASNDSGMLPVAAPQARDIQAQLAALLGLAGVAGVAGAPPPPPPPPPPPTTPPGTTASEQQLQSESAQIMVLTGLAGLGVNQSSIDMSLLTSAGGQPVSAKRARIT